MVSKIIQDVGILSDTCLLVSTHFNGFEYKDYIEHVKDALAGGILILSKQWLSEAPIFFTTPNYSIVFLFENFGFFESSKTVFDKNKCTEKQKERNFIGYVLLKNKKKSMHKFCNKKVIPVLRFVLQTFTLRYFSYDFTCTSFFEEFKEIIIKNFKKL
ncbi:MAG: hypothetical protein EU529_11465 [Promethearchaeota archaeon]|nr:MAG: hypothetical protein EU529_11465 [Candidatus Lokiarchaeota archaeon]